MLTATYTLVALSVEQNTLRAGLQSLRHMVRACYLGQDTLTAAQIDQAATPMQRLYDACHRRKLDKFLVPAVRRATRLADDLLAALDGLAAQAGDALAVSTAFTGPIHAAEQVESYCAVVDAFCSLLLTRLEREEQELFPLARVAVPGEAWFALANQMLAHDAYVQDQRGDAPPVRPVRQPWRARREAVARQGAGLNTLH